MLVLVTVVGQRIEIDVFGDGHMEVSGFTGHEDIEGGAELIESLDLVLTNQACATELACLPSISVNESLSQPISEDWTPQMDMSPRFLQGITFFDANPKRNASIAPTSDTALPAPRANSPLAFSIKRRPDLARVSIRRHWHRAYEATIRFL
ncbi:hypothetical protein OKW41_009009 [Paraburkholderia sp. UCT70]